MITTIISLVEYVLVFPLVLWVAFKFPESFWARIPYFYEIMWSLGAILLFLMVCFFKKKSYKKFILISFAFLGVIIALVSWPKIGVSITITSLLVLGVFQFIEIIKSRREK